MPALQAIIWLTAVSIPTPPTPATPTQDARCVVVNDARTGRVIAGARLRIDGVREAGWSDAAGRRCWRDPAIPTTARVHVEALGFRSGHSTLSLKHPPEASTALLTPLDATDLTEQQTRATQVEVALDQLAEWLRACSEADGRTCRDAYLLDATVRRLQPTDVSTTAATRAELSSRVLPLVRELHQRLISHSAAVQLRTDGDTTLLVGYIDTPDVGGRFAEIRVGLRPDGRATVGVTETSCLERECRRTRELALLISQVDDRAGVAEMIVITDATTGAINVFSVALAGAHDTALSPTDRPAGPTWLTGTVRGPAGEPLPNVEVTALTGDRVVRSDSLGRFRFPLTGTGGAVVLARAMGYAAAFHTVVPDSTASLVWNPRLRSVQQLAAQLVKASGLPIRLASWRYDDFMARRAKGVGKFLVADEIWNTTSLGDALNRVPGVTVVLGQVFSQSKGRGVIGRANAIERIRMLRCNSGPAPSSGRIGVFIDGFERTSLSAVADGGESDASLTAEQLLSELNVADIIGIEVYRGITEIPAEFANAAYCGVIALWSR